MRALQHAKAFVIQFRSADEDNGGRLSGRVEHVASGRTETFQSIDDLPQLLLTMLRRLATDERQEIE
jgi:hypothetical protein